MSSIDLSALPAPAVVEELEFESIVSEMLADFKERYPDYTATVESDPVYKIFQVAAARELLLRQRVNEAAKACMLSYAVGSDLDNLAALLLVTRDEGESDDSFRAKIVLSIEAFSVAGPKGAYEFHALTFSSDIKNVHVTSPEPGRVLVSILSIEEDRVDGTPSAALRQSTETYLSDDLRRPLTDKVSVIAPEVITYSVNADIYTYEGPDAETVIAAARAKLEAVITSLHKISYDVSVSAIYNALHQPNVQRVVLHEPLNDIVVGDHQVAFCASESVTINHGGVDV